MGVSKLNIFVSEIADACGTFQGSGRATVFDCNGVLRWPCGRFVNPNGKWEPVPNGEYRNLPYRCGHLEVELPPGCYWAVAGSVSPGSGFIHLNYTTHVGIVQVCCDETACVKLYNPTARLCWNWFLAGLKVLSRADAIDPKVAEELQDTVEERVLAGVKTFPIEREMIKALDELIMGAEDGNKKRKKA